MSYSWIETEFSRLLPQANFYQGVNLNPTSKAKTQSVRVVDVNKDGVDPGDWAAFLSKNKVSAEALPGGIFKWASVLKPNNSLNDIFSMESDGFNTDEIQLAYDQVGKALDQVRAGWKANSDLTPEQKIKLAYEAIGFAGNQSSENFAGLTFTTQISTGALSNTAAAVLVFAIGQELGWPVSLQEGREQVVLLWEQGRQNGLVAAGPEKIFAEKQIADHSKDIGQLQDLTLEDLLAKAEVSKAYEKLDRGNLAAAREAIEEAFQLTPDSISVYGSQGDIAIRVEDFDSGLPAFEKQASLAEAAQRTQDQAKAAMNLGTAHFAMNHPDDAVSSFRKAIRLDPNLPDAYVGMAMAAANEGAPEGLSYINQAIPLAAHRPLLLSFAYYFRGSLNNSSKKHEEAKADFTKALQINPGYYPAYVDRSAAEAHLGDEKAALQDCEEAIKITHQRNAGAYLCQGMVFHKMSKWTEAKSAYSKGLQLDPQNATLGRLYKIVKDK